MPPLANASWRTRSLGEITDLFDQLRVPLNSRERHERQGIYPYYGAQGVIDHIDAYRFDGRYILVAEDGENLNSKKLPLALFATGKFWVNNHAHVLRGKEGIVDDIFLLACLNNTDIKPFVTGAAQPKLSQSNLRQIEIPLPPLPVQRRIAGVVSAYDELMENCQRRIRILEEMARALYREWFVHFRFPGHEKVPSVDSPLGPIPRGSAVKKLGEIAEVNRAQINARTAPDELRYIDISSVSPGQIDAVTTYTFGDAPGRARRIVQHGDTLWSCVRPNRRSHALLIQPPPNTIASTGFAVLTPKVVPFPFLYFATTTDDFVAYLTNNATGAAYPAVTASTFEKAEMTVPPPALLESFGAATIPMAEQVSTLQRKIQTLRRTRDLLLPRLLSGQVSLDVSAVEDVAEPTAPAPPRAAPRSQTPFGNALAGETPFRGGGERRANAGRATELPGQLRSQTEFGNEGPEDEPALRAAEEAPPDRVERAGRPGFRAKGAVSSQPGATPQEPRPPRASAESATHSTPPTLADESPLQGSRRSSSNPGALPQAGDEAAPLALQTAADEPAPLARHGHDAAPVRRPADEAPVPIDQIDRTEVLQVIRQVFSEGPPRERDAAIRDVARALGYRRTGARIREILHTDLLTAVRRGILENTGCALRLLARSITDYERDFLKQQFLAAIGRPWIDRDTATRDFCRWLGFARTGPVIEDTARSLIKSLLREGRLEADGAELIRRV